jgi:hypothetical protein
MSFKQTTSILVGGLHHLEKYELVNGKDYIPYRKWKIKAMFQANILGIES